jgi:hypothetical protein
VLGREPKSFVRQEEASLVNEPHDAHLSLMDLIHQAKRIDQELAQYGITELGNDTAALAECIQTVRPLEHAFR